MLSALRQFIREALYRMTPPKRFKLDPVDVDAPNTREAGEEAAKQVYAKTGARVDAMSFDARLLPDELAGMDWEEWNIDEIADNVGHALIDTLIDDFGKNELMNLRFFIPTSDDSTVWMWLPGPGSVTGGAWFSWDGGEIDPHGTDVPVSGLRNMLHQPRRERDPATVAHHASKQKP